MAAGLWLYPDSTGTKIFNGAFASGSSWKVALFLSTSNIGPTSTTYAALTNEHANANGYTTGGIAVTASLVELTTPITPAPPSGFRRTEWRFAANPTWTATGGSIITRWAVLYEVAGDVFAYSLLDTAPADVTTTTGNTLTVDSDGTPGPVMTLFY